MLIGQSKYEGSPFEISDWSIKESSSDWKDKARMRIRNSEVVIVICGKNTDKAAGVAIELSMHKKRLKIISCSLDIVTVVIKSRYLQKVVIKSINGLGITLKN